jgi:hypothetical protein
MNAVMQVQPQIDETIIAKLVTTGDLKGLSDNQRISYYNFRCRQVGLDPAAQPFSLLNLQGKMVLYANASCTQQLCALHKLSVAITSREKVEDIYVVCARVTGPDGRSTENTGAVSVGGLKGDALANALLKTVTKATRRTVLAHVGLGMLDETETETIPGAQKVDAPDLKLDPRGDLSGVDQAKLHGCVADITDMLSEYGSDEVVCAEKLRHYIAIHLQPNQELYIAVADELSGQGVISKSNLRKLLETRRA